MNGCATIQEHKKEKLNPNQLTPVLFVPGLSTSASLPCLDMAKDEWSELYEMFEEHGYDLKIACIPPNGRIINLAKILYYEIKLLFDKDENKDKKFHIIAKSMGGIVTSIGNGVDLVVKPPFDRPNASASALLPVAPAAQACARVIVLSINTLYKSGCWLQLPYRSIKFVHERLKQHDQPVPTINFTDDGVYTRQTDWRLYPGCDLGSRSKLLLTKEIPCSYEENNFERYYPIKTVAGIPQGIYKQYRNEAQKLNHITFIGRCGQYIYYDMHQVVANSLKIARDYLSA